MDVEFCTKSSKKKHRKHQMLNGCQLCTKSIPKKEAHWNPQSRNSCVYVSLLKKPRNPAKNSPSQQGHIDLAMARTRSWSKKYVIQLSPNLLVVKI